VSPNPWLILPAAGIGRRMGQPIPKQYLRIDNNPLISLTLSRLMTVFPKSQCLVALAENDPYWPSISSQFPKNIHPCLGGQTRADSVWSALCEARALGAKDSDWVFIHDAVRPCVPTKDLKNLWHAVLEKNQSAALGLPVVDSLRRVDEYMNIVGVVSREQLWRVFTPQAFQFGLLHDCLKEEGLRQQYTDESQAVINSGASVLMVAGSEENIKITYEGDLERAKLILQRQTFNESSA